MGKRAGSLVRRDCSGVGSEMEVDGGMWRRFGNERGRLGRVQRETWGNEQRMREGVTWEGDTEEKRRGTIKVSCTPRSPHTFMHKYFSLLISLFGPPCCWLFPVPSHLHPPSFTHFSFPHQARTLLSSPWSTTHVQTACSTSPPNSNLLAQCLWSLSSRMH